jgi:tRNA threonylcarbamoyl adenosine modification protein YeaZ
MLLVIESATAACSIACIDGDTVVAQCHEIVGRGHAERLMPMIEALLDGRRPSAIAVDCGPGSFTGVRVGLAAAHGLAIGWNLPLVGFSSLALLAAAAARDEDVAVAVQAGHGELFVQSYSHEPLSPKDVLRSLRPDVAARVIAADLVVGSGAEALVAARGYGRAVEALPRAADFRLLPASLRDLPPRPIYGRGPDAKPMP